MPPGATMTKRLIAVIAGVCVAGAAAAVYLGRPGGPPRATTGSSSEPGPAAAPAAPLSQADRDAMRASLRDRVSALGGEYSALEWPASTPEEIGQLLGHDPGRSLGFVRRALRYEPYVGVLRGSAGALAAGAGNSADLALLLRDMLIAGVPASDLRFAMATLPADRAASVVQQAMRALPPRAVWAVASAEPQAAPASPSDADRATLRRAGAELTGIIAGAREHQSVLERVWPSTGLRDDLAGAQAAARRHVWLQVRRGSDWMDLDPVLGQSGPRPESTTADLPGSLEHTATIAIDIERDDNGRLTRSTLVTHAWPTSVLTTRPLQIVVVPDGASSSTLDPASGAVPLERAKAWKQFRVALTRNGGKPVVSDAFDLSGRRVSGSGNPFAIDVFGGARRRVDPAGAPSDPPASITGVRLSIQLTAPDSPAVTIERWLLDRIGPAARAEGRPTIRNGLSDAGAVALSLVQHLDVLFPSGRMSSVALIRDALSPVAGSTLLDRVMDLRDGAKTPLDDLTLPSLPPDLIEVSETALAQVNARLAGAGRAFLSRPNLLIRREGFAVEGAGARARADLDIARAELTVLATDPAAALDARRWYGLLVSELEGPALEATAPASRLESAAASLRAAAKSGVPFALLSTAEEVARLPFDADVRAVMTQEVRDGARLIAPARLPAGAKPAWWRIDAGGGPVAIGADGRGQAGAESMTVLTHVSVPSVARTMKFTACFNEAIAGGRSTSSAGGACLAQAIVDTVKASLDAAIDSFIKNPLNEALDGARAGMLGEDYDKLYQKAKDAWEKFQQAQALLDDPIGETIEKIPGVQEGQAAADAGGRIGAAFGFRMYLMLTMGREIAAYAAQR